MCFKADQFVPALIHSFSSPPSSICSLSILTSSVLPSSLSLYLSGKHSKLQLLLLSSSHIPPPINHPPIHLSVQSSVCPLILEMKALTMFSSDAADHCCLFSSLKPSHHESVLLAASPLSVCVCVGGGGYHRHGNTSSLQQHHHHHKEEGGDEEEGKRRNAPISHLCSIHQSGARWRVLARGDWLFC